MKKRSKIIINGKKDDITSQKIIIKACLSGVLLIFLIWLIYFTISIRIANKNFISDMSSISKLNTKTVFSIDKIYLYSSANAIENKERRAVWNLNLYQFTDMAFYINNRSNEELTYENSVKELYIDDIKINGSEIGEASLYYKNINDFGKSIYSTLENSLTNEERSNEQEQNQENQTPQIDYDKDKIKDKLQYTILNNGDVDYTKPQIYTDCSNPITFEYVNNKIKENHIISDITTDVTYDGNLLRKSGVILNQIQNSVSFRITIKNYYDQEFVANVYVDIPLEDTVTGDTIYNGKIIKKIENENIAKFLRIK